MLEIVFLFYLTRSIGNLARQKGLPAGRWKLYVVLAWFGSELLTGVLVYEFVPETPVIYMACAYAFAIGSYFIVRSVLRKKPDVDDGWLATIGIAEDPAEESPAM